MRLTIRRLSFIILMILGTSQNGIIAQHQEHSEHQHKHPQNEIGVGNYLTYLAGENEFAYSLHIHYLRSFDESRFGAGIGYEQIFDEHRHRSLAFIGTFMPTSHLVLSLAPGMLLGTQENPGIRFALHTELVYEFEIGNFHIGPALEFATTFSEYHISLGVHFAYAF